MPQKDPSIVVCHSSSIVILFLHSLVAYKALEVFDFFF